MNYINNYNIYWLQKIFLEVSMENSDVFDPAWKDEEYDSENGLSPQQVRGESGEGSGE